MNGEQGIAQSKAAAELRTTVTTSEASGGIRYTCTVRTDENGQSMPSQLCGKAGPMVRERTAGPERCRIAAIASVPACLIVLGSRDEVIARVENFLICKAAFEKALFVYPDAHLEMRQGDAGGAGPL